MLRLSIVIPVLGDPRQLDDTLVSVLENRPAHCEILVVHNEPYHDPYDLSDEVRFVAARRRAGLAECLDEGLAAANAPIVHVLACGVEVCPGWADAALARFRDPEVSAVAASIVPRGDDETVISAGLGYRPEGTPWRLAEPDDECDRDLLGPDTLAGFYRRPALDAIGGFWSTTGDALVGVDAALRLRCAGLRCEREPRCAAQVDPALIRGESAFARGRHAERLFWRWASSRGWFRSLSSHAALLAGQCVVALWRPSIMVELIGRACGTILAVCLRHECRPSEPIIYPISSAVAASDRAEPRSARVA